MRNLLSAAIALAILPWILGCDKPLAKPLADPPVASAGTVSAAVFTAEWVDPSADLGAPPHPKPQPQPHPKPYGPQPKGYFHPHPGHPYPGGMHGPWAKHWLGHHYHEHYYLYGVYLPTWQGYTFRVWNGRWLYWSPADYCWYRYDDALGVFIPLNSDGTDAFDTTPPPPPPLPSPAK